VRAAVSRDHDRLALRRVRSAPQRGADADALPMVRERLSKVLALLEQELMT
jgi:hypothetical protein